MTPQDEPREAEPSDARMIGAEPVQDPQAPVRGAGAVLREDEFSLADAVGGPRGAIESVLPTLLFVVLFVLTGSIRIAAITAVAAVALALLARLVQRQSLGSALGGLLGVGIGAVWAIRSGSGSDFYLPGLVINAVSLAILVLSILARRPLVGIIAGLVDPRVAPHLGEPAVRTVYARATGLFAALYAAKLAVQLPLFALGQVAALGVAKLVMGLPLFALVLWLVWLMHRALLHRLRAV